MLIAYVYFMNCCWHEIPSNKSDATIYESTMRLILISQWHHQNREVWLPLFKLLFTWMVKFWGRNRPWAHDHVDVYIACWLVWSKQGNFLLLEAYFWDLNFFGLFEKFLCKTICEPVMTLMLVAWWRHQNKQNTVCFNTDSIWWTLDDLAFRSFCERSHMWTYDNANIDNSAVRVRKFIFIGMLISSC